MCSYHVPVYVFYVYLSLNFFDPSFWTKIKSFRCDILVVSSLNDTFRSRLVNLWDKRKKEYAFSFNGVTSKWRWLLSLLDRENHSVPLWCSAVYVLSCSSLLRFFFQYFVNFISQCFFFQSIIGVKKSVAQPRVLWTAFSDSTEWQQVFQLFNVYLLLNRTL